MSGEITFLVEQIEDEKESWKPDHHQAMQCRDLEDLIRKGMGFYSMFRMADESWSRKVQAGSIQFDEKRARSFRKDYEWWVKPCDFVLGKIEEMEREFGSVIGSAEFRKARFEVLALLRVPVEKIVRGMNNRAA